MNTTLSFVLARLRERSTRVQLAVLLATGFVATGLVTIDQVSGIADTALKVAGVLAPLAAILLPDSKAEVPAEAIANAALAAAQAAAERVQGFGEVKADVEAVAAVVEDSIASALKGA
jgi:hypothetical protein